jgi:hypothetical protein
MVLLFLQILDRLADVLDCAAGIFDDEVDRDDVIDRLDQIITQLDKIEESLR